MKKLIKRYIQLMKASSGGDPFIAAVHQCMTMFTVTFVLVMGLFLLLALLGVNEMIIAGICAVVGIVCPFIILFVYIELDLF